MATASSADRFTTVPSPVGDLVLTGDGVVLTGCYFAEAAAARGVTVGLVEDPGAFAEPVRQLGEYFDQRRTTFEVDLAPEGTDFQLQVWRELGTIAYGQTASYGQIAAAVGRPQGSRAVGAANGANPISIIVPCHRVIGADGSLTGYAGGSDAKRYLLELEAGVGRLA